MKSKYFLIKVFSILGLLMVIFIYFAIYFLPTVKDISKYKRDLKDMNLKISDFVKMEGSFSFANDAERGIIQRSEEELKSRVPEVKNREDFIALFTRVSNYIQGLAREDGIHNLVVTSDSKDLKINAGSLASDKRTLDDLLVFATRRLAMLRKRLDMEERKRPLPLPAQNQAARAAAGLAGLLPGVKHRTVWLSFTADLKNAAGFINHIPWSNYYLSQDRILVSSGDVFPYYLVSLKIFYIDLRPEPKKGRQP
jgi:hypothetical protein